MAVDSLAAQPDQLFFDSLTFRTPVDLTSPNEFSPTDFFATQLRSGSIKANLPIENPKTPIRLPHPSLTHTFSCHLASYPSIKQDISPNSRSVAEDFSQTCSLLRYGQCPFLFFFFKTQQNEDAIHFHFFHSFADAFLHRPRCRCRVP